MEAATLNKQILLLKRQLEKLSSLLLLENGLRETENEVEFSYLVVNDTLSLVTGTTALLWRNKDDGEFQTGEVFSISASPLPDKNAPFNVWATKFCQSASIKYAHKATIVNDADLSESLQADKSQFVSKNAIWLPMRYMDFNLGVLVLWRESTWSEAELRILKQWSRAVAHAWYGLRWRTPGKLARVVSRFKSRMLTAVAAAVLLCMFIPIRLTILAPAEVISSESVVVRSPFQGVIQALHVESNSSVIRGQSLITLDDRSLKTELEVAQQEFEVARAEFRQASQAAAYSEEAKANLQVLRITLEKYIAQVNYLTELLNRTKIESEARGIAIIENSDEMLGRPVQLGERLMTIVDESQLELELWVPVGDDIELQPGAIVNFFPNVAPGQVYSGTLRSMDYQAQLSPLGTLAYRVRASFDANENDAFTRIGMRGTSKLYGNRVSLFYYLFRRPVSFIRQSIGI